MPVRVQWDDTDQTISQVIFEGQFTFADISTAWREEINMLNSVSYPVYSINLFKTIAPFVQGLNVRELKAFGEQTHIPHLQMTVFVAESLMVRQFLRGLSLQLPHLTQTVETLEEAYDLIAAHKQGNLT